MASAPGWTGEASGDKTLAGLENSLIDEAPDWKKTLAGVDKPLVVVVKPKIGQCPLLN